MRDEILISSVQFAENAIQISFQRPEKAIKRRGVLDEVLAIELNGDEEDLVQMMLDDLRQIVETYDLELRNPPQSLPARRRHNRDGSEVEDV